MTFQTDCTLPSELLEQLAEHGLEMLPELIQTVINAVMQLERQKHLGVGPYQRSAERQGQANGYKAKTVNTRVGKITFDVPQVREGGFYPQTLEKGLRSERALKLALAEMYVQGVWPFTHPAMKPCVTANRLLFPWRHSLSALNLSI